MLSHGWASLDYRDFFVFAPDLSESVAHFADRGIRPDRVEQRRHGVFRPPGRRLQRLKGRRHLGGIPLPPQPFQAVPLLPFGRLVDVERVQGLRLGRPEGVHPDDRARLTLHRLLVPVGALGDLPLRIAGLDCRHHPAHAVDDGELPPRFGLQVGRQALDAVRAAQRIDHVHEPGLVRQDLLRAQRQPRGLLGGQRQRLVERVGMKRLRPAEHGGQRLHGRPHHVVRRLLRRERHARRLGVEAQLPRLGVAGAEAVTHHLRPQAPRGPVLRHLFEQIVVCVEEEGDPRREGIHVQTAVHRVLDVLDAVAQREGELLRRRGPGFADVIAAHRDRVPLRHCLGAERHDVRDQPHRGARRVDELLLRDELFQDVVLDGAAQRRPRHALPLGDDEVHRQQHRRRRVDRHRGRHRPQVDALEERLHVGQRHHADATSPDLAERERMVGVTAHQRRQIERHAQPGAAGIEQRAITEIGVARRAEAGELPHRPQPAAVAVRVDAAGVRELSGRGAVVRHVEPPQARLCVEHVHPHSAHSMMGAMAEHGPIFAAMLEAFDDAARLLSLDPGIWRILTHPKRQIIVSCPVQMDNGEIEVLSGDLLQSTLPLGPAKGGIRFHPVDALEEVTALAAWMTGKGAAAHIPFGGGKGGIVCDPTRMSKRELEALTRRYVSEIVDAIGPEKDVPAPDVNTDAQIMAWVMDTYSMHVGHTETAVVTGKPVEMGGSLGRREATGRGVMIVTREAAKHLGFDMKGARVAIQGFGNVGSVSAELLAGIGARIVAVTDWKGGVYHEKGLDVAALVEYTRQHKTVAGFTGGTALANDDLWELDADVLIPAALENQITTENAPAIRARVITEGANGPTTPEANDILHQRGIFVIPDILANSGGVTTSYFEWVQDRYGYFWDLSDVNSRLEKKMCEAFEDVLQTSLKYKVDMRTAAYIVAIARVGTVTQMRGMYA